MIGQSGQHETFFENSRFCRRPLGFRQLAPDASVLLYKHLAKRAKDALRVILRYCLGIWKQFPDQRRSQK